MGLVGDRGLEDEVDLELGVRFGAGVGIGDGAK